LSTPKLGTLAVRRLLSARWTRLSPRAGRRRAKELPGFFSRWSPDSVITHIGHLSQNISYYLMGGAVGVLPCVQEIRRLQINPCAMSTPNRMMMRGANWSAILPLFGLSRGTHNCDSMRASRKGEPMR